MNDRCSGLERFDLLKLFKPFKRFIRYKSFRTVVHTVCQTEERCLHEFTCYPTDRELISFRLRDDLSSRQAALVYSIRSLDIQSGDQFFYDQTLFIKSPALLISRSR